MFTFVLLMYDAPQKSGKNTIPSNSLQNKKSIMGTTHKPTAAATTWNENTFAAGTVWDNDENEWFVIAYAAVEFEAPNTRGLPEDYDEGFSSVEVTRVNVITKGGGQYAKAFESFPPETQKQIVALIESDGQPTYTIDGGN